MLYFGYKDSDLLCLKLTLWQWLFLFSESVMVYVGNWQIQIIFTQSSQYRAQIFVYAKHRLYVRYVHGRNRARNL